jgi:hypothetical protein
MDNETKEILTEQQKLKLLTEHEGWGIARTILTNKILDLQMIGGIDKSSPENALIDLKAKELAVHILYSFLKDDIEGTVSQFNNNNSLTLNEKTYIIRE